MEVKHSLWSRLFVRRLVGWFVIIPIVLLSQLLCYPIKLKSDNIGDIGLISNKVRYCGFMLNKILYFCTIDIVSISRPSDIIETLIDVTMLARVVSAQAQTIHFVSWRRQEKNYTSIGSLARSSPILTILKWSWIIWTSKNQKFQKLLYFTT